MDPPAIELTLFSMTRAMACLRVGTKLGGSAIGDVDMLDRIALEGALSHVSTPEMGCCQL